MTIVIIGVDLGKNACSVVGVDADGAVVVRRSMRRQTLIDYVTKLPACVIAMEACCGAHHLGCLFAARGHDIRLMSPEYVRPYLSARADGFFKDKRFSDPPSDTIDSGPDNLAVAHGHQCASVGARHFAGRDEGEGDGLSAEFDEQQGTGVRARPDHDRDRRVPGAPDLWAPCRVP
jgi:hypothetical protein